MNLSRRVLVKGVSATAGVLAASGFGVLRPTEAWAATAQSLEQVSPGLAAKAAFPPPVLTRQADLATRLNQYNPDHWRRGKTQDLNPYGWGDNYSALWRGYEPFARGHIIIERGEVILEADGQEVVLHIDPIPPDRVQIKIAVRILVTERTPRGRIDAEVKFKLVAERGLEQEGVIPRRGIDPTRPYVLTFEIENHDNLIASRFEVADVRVSPGGPGPLAWRTDTVRADW